MPSSTRPADGRQHHVGAVPGGQVDRQHAYAAVLALAGTHLTVACDLT
ncbi:MAG: hypothetical protein ABIV94_02555 [Acidimicrobiales bacterium]